MLLNKTIILLVLSTTFILFAACNSKDSYSYENEIVKVNVIDVTTECLDSTLNNFGSISYKIKTDISTQVSGTLTNFTVKEGDYVRKNQILAKLTNVQLEIQKEEYETSLIAAKSNYEIQNIGLNDQRLSIESRLLNLEKTDLNIRQKEIELETAKKNLADSELLHELGGITDSEIENMRLSVQGAETDISILRKEKDISSLGLRTKDLIKNGITPSVNQEELKEQIIQLNLQTAFAQLKSAEAQVIAAEQQLSAINKLIDELTIRAPADGIIAAKYYENNEYIKQDEKLTTIIDIASVYAVFYIQEQDMVNFSEGTSLTITIPSLDRTITGKIDEISPIADAQTGNFSVKAELSNTDGFIKPGMFVKCSIQRAIPEYLPCIKETALVSSTDSNGKIFCVSDQNYLTLRNIKIKSHKDGLIWIEEGLEAGERVVNKPSSFLREGQHVEIK